MVSWLMKGRVWGLVPTLYNSFPDGETEARLTTLLSPHQSLMLYLLLPACCLCESSCLRGAGVLDRSGAGSRAHSHPPTPTPTLLSQEPLGGGEGAGGPSAFCLFTAFLPLF